MIIYVNCQAGAEGFGTKESPFRTIGEAARKACPGDTVLVAPGVYREYVDPPRGGEPDARIEYRSEVPLGAELTGSERIADWTPVEGYEGKLWSCRRPASFFGDYNPYTHCVGGDWYFGSPSCHYGCVFLNDRAMFETDSLEACAAGVPVEGIWETEYSTCKWYTEQDGETTVIYGNFQGKDPNAEKVEISVRKECFFPSKTGVGYITFGGFRVSKAASQWAPPASFQDGMVGPHWSRGWIIEDCEISNAKCAGISLGKYRDPENDQYFTNRYVKSPTQMERDAVCRGQYHGWLKENVGGHIVRRCHIHHCEQAGVVGRQGCVFSTVEDCHIHHINGMRELFGAEMAGIKFHAAIDVVMRRNHIHHCGMGIWCDWEAQGTRISQSLMHHNYPPEDNNGMPGFLGADICVEVGHGPTLIDNNVLLSRVALWMASQGIAFVHNLTAGANTSVDGGVDSIVKGVNQPRYTPYHIRHRTEVAGFMGILHGDDRFMNNIFVQTWPAEESAKGSETGVMTNHNQVVGTSVMDPFPTEAEWAANFDFTKPANMFALTDVHFSHLPVWINGNVYLNGAKAWQKEEKKLVNESDRAEWALEDTDAGTLLRTNVLDLVGDFTVAPIGTHTLGKAFEPEQAFEDRDGTPILFNRDYHGDHRGLAVLPGPFASRESAEKALWGDL